MHFQFWFELVGHKFSSNIYFWTEAGYLQRLRWKSPAYLVLSIEEQFYLFFPILLLALHAIFKKGKPGVLVAMWILSFLLCIYGDYRYPDATFYLLPTRAWELLGGALLAIKIFPKVPSGRLSNYLAFAGVLIVFAGIFGAGMAEPSYVYYGILSVVGV